MNILQVIVRLLLLVTAVGLTACGGGGSGGSPSAPVTVATIGPSTVEVQADAGTSSTPTAIINITIANVPDAGVFVGSDFTNNAVVSVVFQQTSSTNAQLVVTLKDPSVIGPGTYTDTIDVGVCLDNQCVKQVSGSPKSITVHYTVTGVQPPQPTVSLATSSVAASTLPFANPPPTTVDVSFQNVSAFSLNVSPTATSNAIATVFFIPLDASHGQLNMYFKSPQQLGVGTFNDVVTVTSTCFSGCARPLVGGTLTLNVQFTVSNTVDGPNGYTVNVVSAQASDIVWSPVSNRIYFSAPSSAAIGPNSISVLNPTTATIESSSFAGSEPHALALSHDGQYLYVGLDGANSIRRMVLSNLSLDLSIPLGSDPNVGGLIANEIEVAPYASHTIAVARRSSPSGAAAAGVAVFDDAVQRTNVVGAPLTPPAIDRLQWASASTLYGMESNSSFSIFTMNVNANGLQLSSTHAGLGAPGNAGRFHYDAGIIYTDYGQAYDPSADLVIGSYVAPHQGFSEMTIPDSQHHKLFMVSTGFSGTELTAFDMDTFLPIRTIKFDTFSLVNYLHPKLIRWGTDGLAFTTYDDKIVLINGAFVSQ